MVHQHFGRLLFKIFWGIWAAFWLPNFALAQQETLALTLEKARALAAENNPEIKAGRLDEKISREASAEARLKRLPLVYGDFNLQRNLIIPVTPVPANAFDPTASAEELRPLQFTTKWTANTGLNGSLDLFNPQKKGAIKEAEINERLTQLENEETAQNLTYETGVAYLAALIAAEQLRLARADSVSQTELLKLSQQQFDEGRLLLSALNQVKAGRNLALNNLEEARQIYANNQAQLLYHLGYDPAAAIQITVLDNLETLFQTYQTATFTTDLPTVSLQKHQQNQALLATQLQTTRQGFLPALSLNAYYGANYFDNSFGLLKSDNWFGNSFVNLGLQLPISEGLERHKKITQLKLQQQAADLRFTHQQNKTKLDLLAAQREAETYQKNYRRTLENFRLSESNLRLAEQQYAEGRLLLSELNQVNFAYQQEKNNYLNQAYQYLSAVLQVEKLSLE